MKPMRAKMYINKVTLHQGVCETVELTPVSKKPYGPNGESEDNTFARYSPSGSLSLTITNPDLVGVYKPGHTFYVDFTPVES